MIMKGIIGVDHNGNYIYEGKQKTHLIQINQQWKEFTK